MGPIEYLEKMPVKYAAPDMLKDDEIAAVLTYGR